MESRILDLLHFRSRRPSCFTKEGCLENVATAQKPVEVAATAYRASGADSMPRRLHGSGRRSVVLALSAVLLISIVPTATAEPCGEMGVTVSAGGGHTCVRQFDGGVKCWGRSNHGQLGRSRTQGCKLQSGLVNRPRAGNRLGSSKLQPNAGGAHAGCGALSQSCGLWLVLQND